MNKSIDKTQDALLVELALNLALEALELNDAPLNNETIDLWEKKTDAAITAIREALAAVPEAHKQPASNVNATGGPKAFFSLAEQPAQQEVWKLVPVEPTREMINAGVGWGRPKSTWEAMINAAPRAALAEQPAQQRIDYRAECWPESPHCKPAPAPEVREQPAQQEPVAWGVQNYDGQIYDCITPEEHKREAGEYTVPLYTSPQRKLWSGLTDEEVENIVIEHGGDLWSVISTIETRLREKNA